MRKLEDNLISSLVAHDCQTGNAARAICPTVSLPIPTNNKLLYPCAISAQVEHRVQYRYQAFRQ